MNGGSLKWLFLVVEVIMYDNRVFLSFQHWGGEIVALSGRVPSADSDPAFPAWTLAVGSRMPSSYRQHKAVGSNKGWLPESQKRGKKLQHRDFLYKAADRQKCSFNRQLIVKILRGYIHTMPSLIAENAVAFVPRFFGSAGTWTSLVRS